MNKEDFIEMLKRHEGVEFKVYKDSLGIETIGVGRNLVDRGLSMDEVEYLLNNDIEYFSSVLINKFPIVNELSSERYYVLLNMIFNMGPNRLSGFKKMWSAIEQHDYTKASIEMLDSKWAKQVGRRAIELSDIMRTGKK